MASDQPDTNSRIVARDESYTVADLFLEALADVSTTGSLPMLRM